MDVTISHFSILTSSYPHWYDLRVRCFCHGPLNPIMFIIPLD